MTTDDQNLRVKLFLQLLDPSFLLGYFRFKGCVESHKRGLFNLQIGNLINAKCQCNHSYLSARHLTFLLVLASSSQDE